MGFRSTVLVCAAAMAMAGGVQAAPAPVVAAARDPLIDGARQCTQHFPVQEQAQGIPTHLLAAISSTESGRWHKGLGMAVPWPWTVNVEGRGYYYDSKAEAIAHTQQFLRAGARSIDVGCMQVNLKHHATAFRDLNEAFDPATNVAYAAQFLRTNYNEMGDWIKATAAYHSRTDVLGRKYLAQIEKSWNRIVTKVAAARANQGLAAQATAQPNFNVASAAEPVRTPVAPRMNRIDATRNVKIIRVADEQRHRGSEVMVINRAPAPSQPIRVADATATNSNALPESGMMVKMSDGVAVRSPAVDIAAPAANSAAAAPSGPKFVFAN